MNKVLSFAHSIVLHIKDDPYLPCPAAIKSQSITNSNIPHRPSIAQALHSFCIQSRQTISAMPSTATTLQQPTLSVHIKMRYTPTTTHPPLPTPLPFTTLLCTQLTNTKRIFVYLCKWWQNGTRCREGVKVLWCHSHLVWLLF